MSEWKFEVIKPSLQSIPYTLAISSTQSIPFGSGSEHWRPCTQPQRWRSQAKYAPLFPPARWNLNGWSFPIASSDGPTPSTPAPDWVPKRHGSPWWPTSEFISRRHGSVVFQAPEIGWRNYQKVLLMSGQQQNGLLRFTWPRNRSKHELTQGTKGLRRISNATKDLTI